MAIIVPIISEDLFIANSPIKIDTGIEKFVPYIAIAQRMYIEPILGVPLLSELQDQIASNSLTADNKALIIEVAPSLSMYAVYQGLPFHWASILNKGVTQLNSENSVPVSEKSLGWLSRRLKDDAEMTARFLIEYLCSCRDKYPSWKPSRGFGCNNGCADSTGKSAIPLDGGIFIPRRR